MVEWFQGELTMSTSNQNGVRRDSEVLVRPSRRIIGGPDKLQILAEVDQARATGCMVLAGPHVMDLVHLTCVRLVQDSVMQHQYPGVQPNLSLHLHHSASLDGSSRCSRRVYALCEGSTEPTGLVR